MGTSYNPKIVTDGLVFNLDPANVKSYPAKQDPFVNNVSLMLAMDGANNSTTFTDSSQNALAATRFGTPVISTTQSKFGGSSAYFNGTSDYITYSSATLFDFSGDFTIEGFWYFSQINQDQGFTILFCGIELDRIQLATVSGGIELYWGGLLISYSIASSSFLNTWTHVAVTRSGTAVKLWINGVNVASATKATAIDVSGLSLAKQLNNGIYNGYFNGYIDEFRVTKGICRYTSTFTPPTAPFSLPGKVNDLTKNRSIATLTNGPTYSGGSLVFDGTNDYITIPASTAIDVSTNTTFEIWIKPSSAINNTGQSNLDVSFMRKQTSGAGFVLEVYGSTGSNKQLAFWVNYPSGAAITYTLNANTWYQIVGTYNGSVCNLYVNGNLVATSSFSSSGQATSTPVDIGYFSNSRYFNGSISMSKIYNKALTVAEVFQNYNATKGRFR